MLICLILLLIYLREVIHCCAWLIIDRAPAKDQLCCRAIKIVKFLSSYYSSATHFGQNLTPCKCTKTHQIWLAGQNWWKTATPLQTPQKNLNGTKNKTCLSHQDLYFICSDLNKPEALLTFVKRQKPKDSGGNENVVIHRQDLGDENYFETLQYPYSFHCMSLYSRNTLKIPKKH